MLVVSRRNGESVYLGDNVKITVVEIKGARTRLGVEADEDTFILRAEKKTDQSEAPAEYSDKRLKKVA